MSHMDYDLNQPKHTPIILSIIVTIFIIFIMTFGLVFYFQGALKSQETKNELYQSKSFALKQLRNWEDNYLNTTNNEKVNLDDAIYITITRYNR